MTNSLVIVDSTLSNRMGGRSLEKFNKDLEDGLKAEALVVEKVDEFLRWDDCTFKRVATGVDGRPDLVIDFADYKVHIEIQTSKGLVEGRYFHIKREKTDRLRKIEKTTGDRVLYLHYIINTGRIYVFTVDQLIDEETLCNPYYMQFKPSYKIDLYYHPIAKHGLDKIYVPAAEAEAVV